MRKRILAGLVVVGTTVAVSAQGWSMTTWFQQTIATQAGRLDMVAAAQAADGTDVDVRGYLDSAWTYTSCAPSCQSYLHIEGWAFERGGYADLVAVDVRLNGFVVDATALVQRYHRQDILNDPWLGAWSGWTQPFDSGVVLDVPLGQLLPGPYGVRLRLYDRHGRVLPLEQVVWVVVQ